ncbi:uncharacterized protein LOC133305005 [Gastrolobium bilobum]|uniref:uncharacterized protein LOC133305005 n=1 Tax=Gastrolobium bilobum TaxID=150636 RepID=UPI002AB0F65E|nr:uncharacterized protein LOC133305005 [Gastrolobium bilobum]XP_061361093.1 uncharacterized protein LOC133305005 [Gastrolobium bilobum]
MKELTGGCRFWHQFVNSNVLPSSNLTDVNMKRAPFLYIMTGLERLDISAVLSNRICHMVWGSRKEQLLAHASLISHFCVQVGLEIPEEEDLDVAPDALMNFITYANICAKSDQELVVKTGTIGLNAPASPRAPRVPLPPRALEIPLVAASSASTSRVPIPPHELVYEDSPSYLRMQMQMEFMSIHHIYQTRVLEGLAQAGGMDYASFQPQYPFVSPAPYYPVPDATRAPMHPVPPVPPFAESSHAAEGDDMED